MSDVGAVVVHYGPMDLLAGCLESLLGQVSHTVVVNHDPHPIPRALKDRFGDRVTWDELGCNLGFGRGVNRGVAHLGTPLVLVTNPDTTLAPGAVGVLAAFLKRNPHMGLAGPRLSHPDGSLQTSSYRLPTLVQLAGHLLGIAGRVPPRMRRWLARTPLVHRFGQLDPHTVEREVEMVSGACFMVRRRALLEAGPFDPGFFLYYEEKDLCRRLWDAGWSVGFVPHAAATHRIGGSAPSRSAVAHRHRALGALRYFDRHGSLLQRVGARLLLACHSLPRLAGPSRGEYLRVLKASVSWGIACDSCS